ncbi:MAG: response regulator [Verrucomicrobiota bacterium]
MIFDPNATEPGGQRFDRNNENSFPVISERLSPGSDLNAGERPRVLLVEDEDDLRVLLGRVLVKRLCADVTLAVDGLDGVRRLRDREYELIVSDVRMPRLSGAALFDWTRTNRPDQAERFLFITGDPGSDENIAMLKSSGRTVLRKPILLADFERHCRRLLQPAARSAQAV